MLVLNDSSIDTLDYRQGLIDLKCKCCRPVNIHVVNPERSRGATSLEDMEPWLSNHSFTPSFQVGVTVPNYRWANVSNSRL